MYEGHMDKAKGGGMGWHGGVKMETIVLEQQLKKKRKRMSPLVPKEFMNKIKLL